MKWFDRWFYSKFRWAERAETLHPVWKKEEDLLDKYSEYLEEDEPALIGSKYSASIEADPHALLDGLRIDIKRLNGGYVVTFRHPNDIKSPYADEIKRNSYIVNGDDNFNEQLNKLITMELLK